MRHKRAAAAAAEFQVQIAFTFERETHFDNNVHDDEGIDAIKRNLLVGNLRS